MARSGLDRWLAPWVLVSTGVVFNVLSALISRYFIGLNNDQINIINREIQQKQVLLDSLWQSRIEEDRKKEFFIPLLADKPAATEVTESYYREYLAEVQNAYDLEDFTTRLQQPAEVNLQLLLDLSDAAQQSIIESINNTYLETLDRQERKLPLEGDNSRLFSIAIFLQVIGLILVLARDLRRH